MINAFKEDFRNFLALTWKHLGLPEPAPIQYDVAQAIQHGPDRFMVQAMRGLGKSYTTASYAAWRLLRDPDVKILCVSAANIRATEFVGLTRQIIEMLPITKHLIPKDHQRDGAHRFDVGALTRAAKDPSVAAYGITSMIVGTHVDIVICDDVETQENSVTVEARDKLESKCLDFENILNPGGRIIYLGTPQTRDSVYNRLTAKGYKTLRWPARYQDPDAPGQMNLAPWICETIASDRSRLGKPTFPEKFDDELLTEREAIMGPSMFALQMMLDTNLADEDRYPLKLRDFVVMECRSDMAPSRVAWGTTNPIKDIESVGFSGDRFYRPVYVEPQWEEFQQAAMFIDPAGRGSDELAIAVGRGLNGYVFIPEVKGYDGGYERWVLEDIAKVCLDYQVNNILIEPNFGDGMFQQLLIPVLQEYGVRAGITEVPAKGQKELRIIDSLEPAMTQHRVVIDPRVARDRTLMEQVTQITHDRGSLRHDDRVEALAGVVRYFAGSMVFDAQRIREEQEERRSKEAAADFIKSWQRGTGKNPRSVVWGSQPLHDDRRNRSWLGGRFRR